MEIIKYFLVILIFLTIGLGALVIAKISDSVVGAIAFGFIGIYVVQGSLRMAEWILTNEG